MNLDLTTKEREKVQKKTRVLDDVNNPCIKEHTLSLNCLDDNGYDRKKCNNYFRNYKNCLDFWDFVKRERRMKGISPILPSVEDRETAKKEYIPSFVPNH